MTATTHTPGFPYPIRLSKHRPHGVYGAHGGIPIGYGIQPEKIQVIGAIMGGGSLTGTLTVQAFRPP